MNQSDVAGRVAAEVAFLKADAEVAVKAVLETLSDALARGESVSIAGFGTLSVKHREAGPAGTQSPDRRSRPDCRLDRSLAQGPKGALRRGELTLALHGRGRCVLRPGVPAVFDAPSRRTLRGVSLG